MDMNRKSRLGLKNKKTQMAASVMKKFIFVLAIFGMLTATAHSAAFLTGGGTPNSYDYYDNNPKITLLGGTQVMVVDRSTTSEDSWAPNSNTNLPKGYTGDDYKAGSPTQDPETIEYTYTDPVYYLGTFYSESGFGNNSDDLELLIKYFLGDDYNVVAYGKYDYDDETGSGTYDGDLSFELFDLDTETKTETEDGQVVTTTEVKGGQWKITDSGTYDPNEKINFYSVKGANEFALYYVHPKHSSGTWTNRHLENNGGQTPGMSHFSVMRTFDSPPPGSSDPVPEPATMLLFGFSLMGLAGMARRKNSKF